MFQTTTATAVPPRPAYPDAARIVVDTDRRTRELGHQFTARISTNLK